jgi:TRAP-type C4-dicarboxylate transport system substrate-binding protein
MLEAVEEIQESFNKEFMELERDALEVMKRHGLEVHEVPKDAERQWRDIMRNGAESLIGKMYSRDAYEMVREHLEEFRRNRR